VITALLLILLIQCGIAAVVFWPARDESRESAMPLLASVAREQIDELRIGDEFDNEAVLVRSGERWLLPDLDNLPADTGKVDAVLRSITTQDAGWPIAHSSGARQRFQVADYYYQRRLSLVSGGQALGTLFLGTSPGFRKVHVRSADQDAIYSIELNTFDVPAASDAWLDPKLLQVRSPLRIDADLYNLYLDNGLWRSATGGKPDEKEVETLVAALRSLQVNGVADENLQRDLAEVEADLVLKVQSLAGDIVLELLTLNDEHFIHSSEFELFFKLSTADYERLTGIDAGRVSGETSGESSGG
jgi:hypothetical protein